MTSKQKKFCDEYLIDHNATQAAIRAGYSKKTAYSMGCENLKKPEIKKYIKERQKKASATAEITMDKVIKALERIGFAEIKLEDVRPKDAIKALEVIARLLGLEHEDDDITQLDKFLAEIDKIAQQ